LKEHSYPRALLDNTLEDNGKYYMYDNIILEYNLYTHQLKFNFGFKLELCRPSVIQTAWPQ